MGHFPAPAPCPRARREHLEVPCAASGFAHGGQSRVQHSRGCTRGGGIGLEGGGDTRFCPEQPCSAARWPRTPAPGPGGRGACPRGERRVPRTPRPGRGPGRAAPPRPDSPGRRRLVFPRIPRPALLADTPRLPPNGHQRPSGGDTAGGGRGGGAEPSARRLRPEPPGPRRLPEPQHGPCRGRDPSGKSRGSGAGPCPRPGPGPGPRRHPCPHPHPRPNPSTAAAGIGGLGTNKRGPSWEKPQRRSCGTSRPPPVSSFLTPLSPPACRPSGPLLPAGPHLAPEHAPGDAPDPRRTGAAPTPAPRRWPGATRGVPPPCHPGPAPPLPSAPLRSPPAGGCLGSSPAMLAEPHQNWRERRGREITKKKKKKGKKNEKKNTAQ